jgi:hypothetical protein
VPMAWVLFQGSLPPNRNGGRDSTATPSMERTQPAAPRYLQRYSSQMMLVSQKLLQCAQQVCAGAALLFSSCQCAHHCRKKNFTANIIKSKCLSSSAHPRGSFKTARATRAVTAGPTRLMVTASPRGSKNSPTYQAVTLNAPQQPAHQATRNYTECSLD